MNGHIVSYILHTKNLEEIRRMYNSSSVLGLRSMLIRQCPYLGPHTPGKLPLLYIANLQ